MNGRLVACETEANDELACALALASSNEADIGANGIGIALNGPSGEPAIAMCSHWRKATCARAWCRRLQQQYLFRNLTNLCRPT